MPVQEQDLALFETARIAVWKMDWETDHSTLLRMIALRAKAYGSDGPWEFGGDAYDEYGEHLVVVDKRTGDLLGAMRLGCGTRLLSGPGVGGFALSRYWAARSGANDLLAQSLEVGRMWIDTSSPWRLAILPALWSALDAYVERSPEIKTLIGCVCLLGYPAATASAIASHFWTFHPPDQDRFVARHGEVPVTPGNPLQGSAPTLRMLQRRLRAENARFDVPPLLRLYATEGARLLAAPAFDETGLATVIPVELSVAGLTETFARMRRTAS